MKHSVLRHWWLLVAVASLFVISFFYYAYHSYRLSPKKVKQNIEAYVAGQEAFFNRVTSDSQYLYAVTVERDSLIDNILQRSQTGIFVYAVNDLGNPISTYWSTSQMFVNNADLKSPDTAKMVKYQNGMFELMKKTVAVKGQTYIIAALIPLHWQYFIQNKYLPSHFAGDNRIDKLYQLSTNAYESTSIKNGSGKTLFYIQTIQNANTHNSDVINTLLHILTILLLILFLVNFSKDIVAKHSMRTGIILFVVSLIILRVLIYVTGFISFNDNRTDTDGLNNTVFAISEFLITTIFVFVLVAFLFFNRRRFAFPAKYMSLAAVAGLCFLSLFTIFTCDVMEMLLYSLHGSFDVNNFFRFSVFTFIGFVILSFIILIYYYGSWLTMIPVFKAQFSLAKRIIITTTTGLLVLSFQMHSPIVIVKLAAVAWLAGYLVLLQTRKRDMYISIFQFVVLPVVGYHLCCVGVRAARGIETTGRY